MSCYVCYRPVQLGPVNANSAVETIYIHREHVESSNVFFFFDIQQSNEHVSDAIKTAASMLSFSDNFVVYMVGQSKCVDTPVTVALYSLTFVVLKTALCETSTHKGQEKTKTETSQDLNKTKTIKITKP